MLPGVDERDLLAVAVGPESENIEELRKFIEAGSSEKAARPRDSRIVITSVGGPVCVSEIRRVIVHAAKLQQEKWAPIGLTGPHLALDSGVSPLKKSLGLLAVA